MDLSKKTCKELREIAKELNITGRWSMTKSELIEAINDCNNYSDASITFETDCVSSGNEIQDVVAKKTTIDYLKEAQPGTLIAFMRRSYNSVMSGKLVGFKGNNVVLIESKKGTIFEVKFDNVAWVQTKSNSWPQWVYKLFNNKDKEEKLDNAISKVRK